MRMVQLVIIYLMVHRAMVIHIVMGLVGLVHRRQGLLMVCRGVPTHAFV